MPPPAPRKNFRSTSATRIDLPGQLDLVGLWQVTLFLRRAPPLCLLCYPLASQASKLQEPRERQISLIIHSRFMAGPDNLITLESGNFLEPPAHLVNGT